jgi:hypothetical protein
MGRRTDWEEIAPGMYRGLGQKMLATDTADLSLLEVRVIEFEASEVAMDFDLPGDAMKTSLNLTSDDLTTGGSAEDDAGPTG